LCVVTRPVLTSIVISSEKKLNTITSIGTLELLVKVEMATIGS
jgi:hypothetical protein